MGAKSSKGLSSDSKSQVSDKRRNVFGSKAHDANLGGSLKELHTSDSGAWSSSQDPSTIKAEAVIEDESTPWDACVEERGKTLGEPGQTFIHDDLLHQRWQVDGPPPSQDAATGWPRQLPHCSKHLFRTAADAVEAHEAAPRWHIHGDYKCVSDSSVSVQVFEQGRQHLQAIAQMQRTLISQTPSAAGRRGKVAGADNADKFLQGHRPLFSYKRYADQEPLELSLAETASVVAIVLGPGAVEGLLGSEYSALLNSDSAVVASGLLPGGKAVEVNKTAGVLIKLVMDMWIAGDPRETFTLILSMLHAALQQPDAQFRIRVFDMLYNLSLHAHMIESETTLTPDGQHSNSSAPGGTLRSLAPRLLLFAVDGAQDPGGRRAFLPPDSPGVSRVELFEQWLCGTLFELMLSCADSEKTEEVWQAAHGVLTHLTSTQGVISTHKLAGLSSKAVRALLDNAQRYDWSLELQSDLLCMACHLCYMHTENDASARQAAAIADPAASVLPPPLNPEALQAFGGVPALIDGLTTCPSEQAQRCILAVLLDCARGTAVAREASLSAYLDSEHCSRTKALLSSDDATAALALMATSTDPTANDTMAQATARHLGTTRDASRKAVQQAVLVQQHLLLAMPTVPRCRGDVWKEEQSRLVDACLSPSSSHHAQAQSAVCAMLRSTKWDTSRRAAQLLAAMCWNDRATSVRSAIAPLLHHKNLPDTSALATVSLLAPPPPPPHSRSPKLETSVLTPLLTTLAESLVDPVRSRTAAQTLLSCLSTLFATFLFCKPGAAQHGTGSVRTSAHHVFISAATITVAAQWLKHLPQRSQQSPMLRLAWQLLDVLTVPRPAPLDDSARARPSAAASKASKAGAAAAARRLSQVTLFLQGRSSVPSLSVAALPASLLVLLRDRLAPASRLLPSVPPPAGQDAPLTAAGFQGWLNISEAGADAGAAPRSGVLPLPHGLSHGLASMMDARLAIFVILMWKCRLDDSALDAVGGCRSLKAALQDDDVRVRFLVADFMQTRASSHKPEELRTAMQHLVGMAQSSSNGALVENPYVQLQAFLRHDLLSVDDL